MAKLKEERTSARRQRSNRILERFFRWSCSNRSCQPVIIIYWIDQPAARETIDCYLHLPQLPGESVDEFCLPPASAKPSARQAVFDLVERNAGFDRQVTPEVLSIQNFITVKKRRACRLRKGSVEFRQLRLRQRRRCASEGFC